MKSAMRSLTLATMVLFLPAAVLSANEGVTLENVVSPGPNRADEPLAEKFSMQEAVRFLDSAALTWQRQRKCFACHSNHAFLTARPAMTHDVPAHRQVREAAGWKWLDDNEPPSEIEEHYGVTMAAIGVGIAPDDYSQTPAAKEGLEKIRQYLQSNPPANTHNRAMKMLASLVVDGIMAEPERKEVVQELLALQRRDGGWNLATLGANWKRVDGTPQDYKTSDGYGTGFVIYALRMADVPADDPRIQKGIEWLKTHQRASGRWFTRSMDKDSRHYITHSGTAYAILALAACGETAPATPPGTVRGSACGA